MATSQDFVNWTCGPNLDSRYLLYLLLSEVESLKRFAYGTTHHTIYFPEVKAFHVCIPEIKEQRAVASVLAQIDGKIEHNRHLGERLEHLADRAFHAWFISFDPVKAKVSGQSWYPSMPQELFDSLPDSWDSSPIGPVPSGWRLKPLSEVANFLNGLALQKFPPKGDDSDLPVIKIAQLRKGSTEGADRAGSAVPSQYVVDDRDLLFSWSGTLDVALWFGGRGALNQHLFSVTSDQIPRWMCLLWIRHYLPWFRSIATSKATTMGHINRHHLDDALVVIPPPPVLEAAHQLIGSAYDMYSDLMIESRRLANLRDYLLPKLLSGSLRLSALSSPRDPE